MGVFQGRPLLESELTHAIIGAFFDVYNQLGWGFMESVYASALTYELIERGHRVSREAMVRIQYKGRIIARQRVDMLVEDRVLLELKSTHELPYAADRQLFNYLRASGIEVGLLLHFGPTPKFHRLVCERHRAIHPAAPDPQHP